ncbi:ATP-binding protein [Carboxylicivirga caseinilyticus]|uniref:ATP-binding protein n=1 Tax=Carboxylicivirga caseinilyticus TaxID=3417572 RepID=UPI003D33E0FE|nr:ATP-binding protein [Marinilabiliaceae bacterium A049]
MKFYNRESELALLDSIREQSKDHAKMTVLVGRRRIGKTSLIKKSNELNNSSIYFFVARKNEVLLCEEFVEQVIQRLGIKIFGSISNFKELFQYLMELSLERNFTLIIDEFQEFYTVNPSVYSDMQNIWDTYKNESRINLILCGSIYSLMNKIFENSKEPLFARATDRILIKAFSPTTIKKIMADNNPDYKKEDLLAFYTVTGGVAKYVELLVNKNAYTLDAILSEIYRENSLFIDEGRNILIEEFGKDYATYFSILSLIASSKTSRPEIESILETSVGGYLERLEKDFNIIRKVQPILAKPGGRNMKYTIEDNFLNFWFRFVYKYQSAVEIGNFDYVRDIVERDYKMYSGRLLEKYFIEDFKEQKKFSTIGTYWEKRDLNEIDIVAVNDFEKTVIFAEVKRNKENISIIELQEKAQNIKKSFKGYAIEYKALSMEDM